METRIITQPFDQHGEPQNLGDILFDLLSSDDIDLNHVWLISAWVNHNSIRRFYTTLENLRDSGTEIHIYFGINFQGTYIEAIRSIFRLGVDSKVIYNPTYRNTYHPKIYILEGPNTAHIFVGSNNFTDGGFYRNYEATIWLSFDLPREEETYLDIRNQLNEFLEPNEAIAVDLTEELIENLIQGNLISSRREIQTRRRRAPQEEEVESIEGQIDTENIITEELPFQPIPIPNPPAVGEQQEPTQIHPANQNVNNNIAGTLVWQKSNLPMSDVQRQPGNPTGGLRLTQARFEVNGQRIDQTTYFRNTIFSNGFWARNQYPPLRRETARFPFEIIILDNNYGIHELTISHKPSGEAGQGNYTTLLHWGHLGTLIRDLNLVGTTFNLYRLPENEEADFRIVISH